MVNGRRNINLFRIFKKYQQAVGDLGDTLFDANGGNLIIVFFPRRCIPLKFKLSVSANGESAVCTYNPADILAGNTGGYIPLLCARLNIQANSRKDYERHQKHSRK